MVRPAPPSDDGSPARLIATMVGIVGILLLGSLAWSAVGALVSALGAATSAVSTAASPPPPATLAPAVAVTPLAIASPTAADAPTPTMVATLVASPTAARTPTPQMESTPTAAVAGRNPWILLPQPEPGARIPPGTVTLEARSRGDAPITAMRLELDGAPLPVALEQRSDTTWRGSATAKVGAGSHNVRATVTDATGRSGSFRWTFTAAPGP